MVYLGAFFVVSYTRGSGKAQQIPASFSAGVALSSVGGLLLGFVPILLFLVLFVRHTEGRGFGSAFSSLGLNGSGVAKSIMWCLGFMVPLILAIGLWNEGIVAVFGSGFETAQALANKIPQWYAGIALFNVVLTAVTEEAVGRGYMLDRLMPSHPAGLGASLPAVLGVSVLGMLYHVPEYVLSYSFSPLSSLYNLVIVFLSFTFVGLGYVRSRVRSISGPILVHFLLDAVPYVLML